MTEGEEAVVAVCRTHLAGLWCEASNVRLCEEDADFLLQASTKRSLKDGGSGLRGVADLTVGRGKYSRTSCVCGWARSQGFDRRPKIQQGGSRFRKPQTGCILNEIIGGSGL